VSPATPTSWPVLLTETERPELLPGLVAFHVSGLPVHVSSDGTDEVLPETEMLFSTHGT